MYYSVVESASSEAVVDSALAANATANADANADAAVNLGVHEDADVRRGCLPGRKRAPPTPLRVL